MTATIAMLSTMRHGLATALTVTADDGVQLYAEVHGPPTAKATVVLCHGYTLDATSWHASCAALADRHRVVLWDHRGHGRSESGAVGRLTVDQLGLDLAAVVEQTVPSGPVVLAGHSMGGMAIMALAEHHPEMLEERIAGVALVTTSARPLEAGASAFRRASAAGNWLAFRALAWCDRRRLTPGARAVQTLARLMAGTPGCRRLSPASLARVAASLDSMTVDVVAHLLCEILHLDKRHALQALDQVRTLVIGAEHDAVIPVRHSELIARHVRTAEFVVVPGAGHTVVLDQPEAITAQLQRLVDQVTDTGHARSSLTA